MNIIKTAQIVGCSQSAIVSTYAKYMNDDETNSRYNQRCWTPLCYQGKQASETVSLSEVKLVTDSITMRVHAELFPRPHFSRHYCIWE